MSEDYTYEPLQFTSVPSADLDVLLNDLQAANQRIADLEHWSSRWPSFPNCWR